MITLILITLLILAVFTLQKNFPTKNFVAIPFQYSENKSESITNETISTYNTYEYKIYNVTLKITHPLLFKNIRWAKMPIFVKIDNNTCIESRRDDIRYAMLLWGIETDGVVQFKESENNYQVFINCSKELWQTREGDLIVTKLGEGGPTKIIPLDYFNLTIEASATIYSTTKECSRPIRILHELGHVLGLDHVEDEKSIMYPYEDCNQGFTREIKETLKELYKIKAMPDLYFKNATASSSKIYLNISFEIVNAGILSSPPAEIDIFGDNVRIDRKIIEGLEPGEELNVWIQNIYLGKELNNITLIIDPNNFIEEISKENNKLILIS